MVEHDPASELPWGFDWTEFLAELGDGVTIEDSEWAIDGPDAALEVSSPGVVGDELLTEAMFRGGTLHETYIVTNTITTNTGVVEPASFFIRVVRK